MNKTMEGMIEQFKLLSYNEQYDKIKSILTEFKYEGNVFDEIYGNFINSKFIDQQLLVEIYETILMIFQDISSMKQDKLKQKRDVVKQKLENNRKIEEQERIESDDILNKLEYF